MIFSISLIYLLLLHISLATASPSHFSPRKSTSEDPYIVCNNPAPISALPDGYLAAWYPTTLALCSALNGAARNVGCICHTSTGDLHCDEAIADPVLWRTQIPLSFLTFRPQLFPEYCHNACFCSTAESARRLRTHPYRRPSPRPTSSASPTTRDPEATNWVAGVINVPWGRGGRYPIQSARDPIPIQANATWSAQGGGGNRWQNSCGRNCTSNADCSGKDGCTCLAAQKSAFQPGVGTVAFVAACIVNLAAGGAGFGGGRAGSVSGGGGKRDVDGGGDMACPCNETYVSQRCCEVEDGLVWEGREFKLGELVKGDEL